jgi:hypothetical protein
MAGSSRHGNENTGSIKSGKFLDYTIDCWLLKEGSTPSGWLLVCGDSTGDTRLWDTSDPSN